MISVTWLGLAIGLGGILLGQGLEGGAFGALFQGTAALIVFGGTLGATMVSSTREDLRTAFRLLKLAFGGDDPGHASSKVAGEIVEAAQIARKDSLLSLERRLIGFSSPFMQSAFRLVIDGVDPASIREILEAQLDIEERNLMAGAKVWIDAGGFAPTVGIIGAVLGLIHVMNNITDTSKLGAGIAVAFVATIYGVASANLALIPIGQKLRRRVRQQIEFKEMILDGAVDVANNVHPFVIHEKLRAYLGPDAPLIERPPRPAPPLHDEAKASA